MVSKIIYIFYNEISLNFHKNTFRHSVKIHPKKTMALTLPLYKLHIGVHATLVIRLIVICALNKIYDNVFIQHKP